MKEREALTLALEALKTAQNNLAPSKGSAHAYGDGELWDKYADAIKACEEALAQPEQEPVARVVEYGATVKLEWASADAAHNAKVGNLYTTPPQRTWVGLTDEEVNELVEQTECEDYYGLVEATESKLKEKNGI